MQHLGLLFTLGLLGANLWGLMLAAGLYWRNRWFALPAGPMLAVTGVYAIECHLSLIHIFDFIFFGEAPL